MKAANFRISLKKIFIRSHKKKSYQASKKKSQQNRSICCEKNFYWKMFANKILRESAKSELSVPLQSFRVEFMIPFTRWIF